MTIVGGSGNDTVESSAAYVMKYSAGDGFDVIEYVEGATLAIDGSIGKVSVGSGSDSLDVLVTVGSGNIRLKNARNQPIALKLANAAAFSTVLGAMHLVNGANSTVLTAFENADTIENNGSRVTIGGGKGNDSILNRGNRVSISGGAGNDFIDDRGENVTINGGAGNDTIALGGGGALIQYSSAHGNDVIENFGVNDTIQLTAGSLSATAVRGGDLIATIAGATYKGTLRFINLAGSRLNVNGKKLTLETLSANVIVNSNNNTLISGSASADSIINTGRNVTIASGGGHDTITGSSYADVFTFGANAGNNVITNFGKGDSLRVSGNTIKSHYASGNNEIVNLSGGTITLLGAGGNLFRQSGAILSLSDDTVNYINNTTDGANVVGTDDNDVIVNSGASVTINGGAGNDSITGSDLYGEVFAFGANDGNDVITNFDANDTLRITSGTLQAITREGENAIASVRGASRNGTITLLGAANLLFKQDGNVLTVDNVNAIDNRTARITVNGTGGRDYITNSAERVTLNGGAGDDTFEGSDFGEMYLFASNTGNNVITNFGKNDTIRCTAGNIATIMTLGNDAIVSLQGTSYNGTVTLLGAASLNLVRNGKFITVDAINTINNSNGGERIVGTDGADYIYNSADRVTIQPNGGNDTIEGADFGELFLFDANDGNNIILNFGANDTLRASNGTLQAITREGEDAIVSIKGASTSTAITLLGAANRNFITNGNALTVETLNPIDNGTDGMRITGTDGADVITNSAARVTIQANGGNDSIVGSELYGELYLFSSAHGDNTIANFGKNDTIKCTAGNIATITTLGNDAIVSLVGTNYRGSVRLVGAAGLNFRQSGNVLTVDAINYIDNASDNTLVTGTGGRDFITNSGNGVSIQSGAGSDTIEGSDFGEMYLFASNTGNNVITNFGKNDTIKCTAGNIATITTLGNDAIVSLQGTSYNGTITLLGAANLNLVRNGKFITVDAINTINNSDNGVRITGTGGRDFITNSGANVTIQSNGGDDTIEGSTNGEVYVFGANGGNNLITNFDAEDTLIVSGGGIQTLATVGADVTVGLSGGNVTLQGAASLGLTADGNTLTAAGSVATLNNDADSTLIAGSDRADYIVNGGQGVSIQSNGGNDTVTGSDLYGEMYLFSSADGDNVITNFGKNDTLKMTAGNTLAIETLGNDVVATLQGTKHTGTVRLIDAASLNIRKSSSYLVSSAVNRVLNRRNNTTVNGTGNADLIENTGSNVTINGKGGNDTIIGSSNGEVICFGSDGGMDYVANFGKNDSLAITAGNITSHGRLGNDYVVNVRGAKSAGAITLGGAGGYVFAQDGKFLTPMNVNYVVNRDDGVRVTGTGGNDYITNSGDRATIAGGKGNDTIEGSNFGEVFAFGSNEGDNLITNFGLNDTLVMTAGSKLTFEIEDEDAIVSLQGANYIGTVRLAGAGNYILRKNGSTLTAEAVNYIDNGEDSVRITGTGGKDWITNSGEHVTIAGSAGNDTITGSELYGEVMLFASNTGNNVVTNFGINDTLKCTAGSIKSVKKSGNDYVVSLKGATASGTVTLKGTGAYRFIRNDNVLTVDDVTTISNALDNTLLVGTDGRDWIENSGQNVTIQGSAGNDTITGSTYAEVYALSSAHGQNVITNFGVGDSLKMTAGKSLTYKKNGNNVLVTLAGSSYTGNATLVGAASLELKKSGNVLYAARSSAIVNLANNVKVTGTSGADSIENYGAGVTVQAGGGNDTITGSDYAEVYAFSSADGDNVITNFGVGDTLRMTSGKTLSIETLGNDYVVELKGTSYTGHVTLSGAATRGNLTTSRDGKSAMLYSNEVITANVYWFEEEAAADELSEIVSEAGAVEYEFDELSEMMSGRTADWTLAMHKRDK